MRVQPFSFRQVRPALLLVVALAISDSVGVAQTEKSGPAAGSAAESEAVTYEQVRAVFKKHCLACHNADRERGGLDLSTIDGIKSGGASGHVVVSGKPDESLLFTLPAQLETPKMPPNKPKIPQREIDLIRRWIESGPFERVDPPVKSGTTAAKSPAESVAAPAVPPSPARVAAGLAAGVAIEPLRRATAITALAVNPKTPLVAVSGHRQVVLFQWNEKLPAADETRFEAFPFPEGDVFALRFTRDGELLLAGGGVGGQSGKVVGFNVATGKRLFELGDESDAVLALDISSDKSLVALGGPGRSVKIIRTATGELAATLRKHTDWILSLAFSPDGLLLASGDRFGGLQVWEAASGKEFLTLRGHVGAVQALGWSADSDRLLSAGQDGVLRFWDMHEGALVTRWEGGTGGILAVDGDAAGCVVCGGRERKITVWKKPDVRLQEMSMPDEVVKVGLSHDSSRVIAGDAAGNIAIFSLPEGNLAGQFALPLGPAPARTEPRSRLPAPPLAKAPARPASGNLAAAEEESRRAGAELAVAREASALADAAIKGAEDSLKKLRESAAKLAQIVASREAAAKQAAQRVADLRAHAEAARNADAVVDLPAEREQLSERLTEKRSLLEAARAVTERIQRAAARAPGDTGLEAAAKLAAELQNRLARDVEAAAGELRRLEESSGTTQE
jgi:mono/diheme cytochrome c family protein